MSRLESFFKRHPLVAVLMLSAFCALFAVVDLFRLRSAANQGADVAQPMLLGSLTAIATVCWWLWLGRHWAGMDTRARKVWRSLVYVSLGAVGLGFWLFHSLGTPDRPPMYFFEVAVLAYTTMLLAIGAVLIPLVVPRRTAVGDQRSHHDGDEVVVHHIIDRSQDEYEPYFVAVCDCGWEGTVLDAGDVDAHSTAFAEARAHGTNVKAAAFRPLD